MLRLSVCTTNASFVVFDRHYPRPMSSAKAVTGDHEGQTWRDEVYVLSNGQIVGFSRTVTLEGKEMLTLTESYFGENLGWNELIGNIRFRVIRWRSQQFRPS